jgi:hypothetical protein
MPAPKHLQTWQSHLSAYRKAHPNASMKTAMQEAAKTYKKGAKT